MKNLKSIFTIVITLVMVFSALTIAKAQTTEISTTAIETITFSEYMDMVTEVASEQEDVDAFISELVNAINAIGEAETEEEAEKAQNDLKEFLADYPELYEATLIYIENNLKEEAKFEYATTTLYETTTEVVEAESEEGFNFFDAVTNAFDAMVSFFMTIIESVESVFSKLGELF